MKNPKIPTTCCPVCGLPVGLTHHDLPPELAPVAGRNHNGNAMLTLGPLRWIRLESGQWQSVNNPDLKGL